MSWQTTITELTGKLSYVKSTGQFSDVTLVVGEGEEVRRFSVHRMILAMYSEVMAALFYGPMKESKEEVTLIDDDPEYFEVMMRYIYCQDVEFPFVGDAIGVYQLADKYLIPHLKEKCLEYLYSNISAETALEIYEMAITADQPRLQMDCWRYVTQNTTNVLASHSFGEVSDVVMQRVVTEENLTIASEVEIYKALCSWGRHQCKRRGHQITGESMRSILAPYLWKVRFLTFSVEEFITELGDLDILAKSEQLDIIKNMIQPKICSLPLICSRCEKARKPLPSDLGFIRFGCEGNRSFSEITSFPTVRETFELFCDVFIYGVEIYLSSSSTQMIPPEVIDMTLTIRNLSDRPSAKQIVRSDPTDEGIALFVEEPVFIRNNEVCEIMLEGHVGTCQRLYLCTGDCYSHRIEFAFLDKEAAYHFHAIYAFPV